MPGGSETGRIYHGFDLSANGRKVVVAAFVDTGSDSTVISRRVADALRLSPGKKEELETAGGQTIQAGSGTVRVVSELDGIDDVVTVLVTDVPFRANSEENIDMIVGLDFLQKHRVRLSFRQ